MVTKEQIVTINLEIVEFMENVIMARKVHKYLCDNKKKVLKIVPDLGEDKNTKLKKNQTVGGKCVFIRSL